MKIGGTTDDFSEYILGDFAENSLEPPKSSNMDPLSSGEIQLNSLPSPTKMDGIAEIENILRLISKSQAKEGNKKDFDQGGSTIKIEQDPLNIGSFSPEQSSSMFPPFQQPSNVISSSGTKTKIFESNNADVVELLRRMLDRTLQALKICHQKLAEANKRHESSQLEIQKLQDEIRNLRAQANPPQLQLMKGISSLSSGNKRRRFHSPSSTGSSSRSSFSSSRRHSSRRSESPPQLSPAFIPRPVGSSSSTQPSKRPRFGSPHSTGSYYSEGFRNNEFRNNSHSIINHDHNIDNLADVDDDARIPEMKCPSDYDAFDAEGSSKATSSTSTSVRSKVLRSNMKNTSHLISSESKRRHGKVRSSSVYSPHRFDTSRLRSGSSSSTPVSSSRNLLTTAPQLNRSNSSSNKSNPPLRTYGNLRSSSASRVPEKLSRPVGRPRKGKAGDLEPPELENHAESESDEEFDAFTAFKNEEDDSSEELVDIDDDFPPRPLPLPTQTSGSSSSGGAAIKKSRDFNESMTSKGKLAMNTSDLSKSNETRASSVSLPSSPLSSVESNKSSSRKDHHEIDSSAGSSRKFRSTTLSSRAATQSVSLSKSKLRKSRHSSPTIPPPHIPTESPFPPRQFDKKIDYSTYLNGKYPLSSENVVDNEEEEEVKIKTEPEVPSTSKSTKRGLKEILERFAMQMDDAENCMMTKVPYSFYQAEIKPISEPDIDNDTLKSGLSELNLVEIPRWRERIFEPYLGPISPRYLEEALDDQAFLKRHTKCEIAEKRRKRWDSQRMREESYLEKLKQKREEREKQKKLKRRRGRNSQNDKAPKEEDVFTFQPGVADAVYVRNDVDIPISVFGYPLPLIEPEEFELPWAVPTKPIRSPRKSEVSKLQSSSSSTNNAVRSSLKNALRQQGKR